MTDAPFYLPIGDEAELFTAAWQCRLPVLLRGPTGCGKTRFLEHMAASLSLQRTAAGQPSPKPAPPRLLTIACHAHLTIRDLTGHHLQHATDSVWVDGPLTQAVRHGSLCYLDELAEARADTLALIHPLTDHRRVLPLDQLAQLLPAHPDFMLVASYNPGLQREPSVLTPSTRQRFVTIDFAYAPPEQEAQVIMRESGVRQETATGLATLGHKVRSFKGSGVEQGVSTRLLVYAARLINSGVSPRRACDITIARSLTDDKESSSAIRELSRATFST